MHTGTPVGFSLLRIASLYMMAAFALGLYMEVTHSFALISVHSHIGLLGWLTMAVTGLVYLAAPRCDGNGLTSIFTSGCTTWACRHRPISLIWNQYGGGSQAEAAIGIGSTLVVVAILLFTGQLTSSLTSKHEPRPLRTQLPGPGPHENAILFEQWPSGRS